MAKNLFKGAKTAEKGSKVEDDYIGGGGAMETDIYDATIKTAYMGKSQSSDAVNMSLLLDVNGKEVRATIWMTNKNGGITYKDKAGVEQNLPGYNQVNSLAMLVLGKEIGDCDVEELIVKLYDYDAKKDLPQAVDCYSEFHGEKVQIALQKQTVDKTAKNEATGDYEPTGDTRDVNEVVKFFPADKRVTISEVAMQIKTLGGTLDDVLESGEMPQVLDSMSDDAGAYAETWLEKNQGQTYDRSEKAKGGKSKSEGKSFGGSKSSGGKSGGKSKGLFS